ncbi:MAG TPA: hypothetical protein PLL78_03195 [Fimbriimonadaceae bacterium]|nr:hypothetical protein [Fimbriimonadaceae bacterium]HRJ95666.1 hypothetical protein [Fimbriimonadaceae bacterium]
MTTAETFLWYSVTPSISLGLAHLWKQNALRYLASVRLAAETERWPGFYASAGVQGIGTGNPGFSATAEKNFQLGALQVNAFIGLGYRTNESHTHPVGGFKLEFADRITIGLQWEGHNTHPFITKGFGHYIAGVYLIEGKSPGLMFGARF